MDHSYQRDNIYQIIEAIINELSYDGDSRSIIADILISILETTPYTGESPKSVIGQLLLRLKDKLEGNDPEPYEDPAVSNIAKILISIINETEYTDPPRSNIAELLLELKEKLETLVEITVTGNPVTFTTNVSKPLKACSVNIPVRQEGSGDPSPDNVRNFIGFNSFDFTANQQSKTFNFGQTVYAVNTDILTGKSFITHKIAIFDGSENWNKSFSYIGSYYIRNWVVNNSIVDSTDHLQNIGVTVDTVEEFEKQNNVCRFGTHLNFKVDNDLYPTLADFKNLLSQNNLQVLYPLATPIEIDLEGMDIITNIGENNLISNLGNISATYLYKDTNE
jgi:hypothetical protein